VIIHKKENQPNEQKNIVKSLGGLIQGNRVSFVPLVTLAVVFVSFMLGVLAQRGGAIRQVRNELGITDNNVMIMKGLIREPRLTLDSLLNAQLPTISIDVGFDDLTKLNAKREEATELGILIASDEDFVPAEIRYEDRVIRVEMRLKGDLMDHLDREKWSYRIHVKGDDQLFGIRRFSIQHPGTRKYLLEWGWLENLRMEGVLAPRYTFLNVVLNGEPLGIYALEEHFSKELLESQERREGVIIAFDESDYWERYGQLGYSPSYFDFVTHLNDYKNSIIDTRRASYVSNDPILSRERDEAVGLLRAFQEGALPASDVFDVRLLARFLAVSELWHTYHALYWNNVNFYYNPIMAKLEPIGFDGTADPSETSILYSFTEPWIIQALEDPIVAEAYIKELDRISHPEYLEQLRGELEEPSHRLRIALYREFPFIIAESFWEDINKRQSYIQDSLNTTEMVFAFENSENDEGFASKQSVTVNVRNILSVPIEIIGFQVDDQFLPSSQVFVNSDAEFYINEDESSIILKGINKNTLEGIKYTTFNLPVHNAILLGGQSTTINVLTRILGTPTVYETPVLRYPDRVNTLPIPSYPSYADALERYPFLEVGQSEDMLSIRKGEWEVDGDLVLPDGVGLEAGPGTKLLFERDSILVSTGALTFRGTPDAPVYLGPVDDSWGGLVVMGTSNPSTWENVIIMGTHGIQRSGWILTGGITFYRSPINLIDSKIVSSEAEDGINVIHSPFEFQDCEFSGMGSDAFDGDFTEGVIQNCVFQDIRGDAIDLSGSKVNVNDVVFRSIGDKGISAGENSQVVAGGVLIVNSGVAVASKDLSHVRLEQGVVLSI